MCIRDSTKGDALGKILMATVLNAFAVDFSTSTSELVSSLSTHGRLSSSQKRTWNPCLNLSANAVVSSAENSITWPHHVDLNLRIAAKPRLLHVQNPRELKVQPRRNGRGRNAAPASVTRLSARNEAGSFG